MNQKVKSRILATFSYWLIGGAVVALGDALIPSTGWVGGGIFLFGWALIVLPFVYFGLKALNKKAPPGIFPLENHSPKFSGRQGDEQPPSAHITPMLSRRSRNDNNTRKPL